MADAVSPFVLLDAGCLVVQNTYDGEIFARCSAVVVRCRSDEYTVADFSLVAFWVLH